MADPNFKKISDMAALTTAAADDIIPIVDVSEAADANKNKKITTANLRKGITNAELAGSITAAKIAGISSDPNADRIVFWDDSATSLAYLAPSTGLQVTDTSITTKDSEIVHDNLSGFVADEHVAHSDVTITAGTGLSGGGTIAASRTIDLNHLGIEDLTDPGADRIAFWDDSAGAMKWLTAGSGLAIAGTTLNAANIGSVDIADGAVTSAKLGSDVGAWLDSPSVATGWAVGYTCMVRYCKVGKMCFVYLYINGTSSSSLARVMLPFSVSVGAGFSYFQVPMYRDNSIDYYTGGGCFAQVTPGTDVVRFILNGSDTGWTASGSKAVTVSFFCEAE